MVPEFAIRLLKSIVQKFEDIQDIREADKAMREYERDGKSVKWEAVKNKYGICDESAFFNDWNRKNMSEYDGL
ncbi:MAG: hypothetical protein WCX65_02065 [bacterium]